MSERSKNISPGRVKKPRPKIRRKAAGAGPRRPEILSSAALALIYGISVHFLDPTFKERPYALLTHLLLLMGFNVVFFGLWDDLALRALRRLLRRDREALLETYAVPPEELRRKLADSSFESPASPREELGGGLVFAALRRYQTLGRPPGRALREYLAEAANAVRIGTPFLAYAIASAPLLGLLGTIVGLKATFENSELLKHGSMQLDKVMPYLGVALVTTLLGLTITLLGMLFVHLINGAVARDCRHLLTPVAEAIEVSLAETAPETGIALNPGLAAHLFEQRSWSSELARHRRHSGAIALLGTCAIIVLVCLPGGMGDRLLSTGPTTPEEPVPLIASPPPEDPPPPPPEPQQEHFEISLQDLLELYEQAVEPQQVQDRIFAFLRYQEGGTTEQDELGESRLSRTYAEDHIPIGGFFDIVEPPEARWKLDLRFPRLVARFDCLLRDGALIAIPTVTYAILDGGTVPRLGNSDFLRFLEYAQANGYRSDLGQLLDRKGIQELLPGSAIRAMVERAVRAREDSGQAAAGDQPVVLWLVYEPKAKIKQAIGSFEDLLLEGRYGDLVVLHWHAAISVTSEVTLRSIEVVSPTEVDRLLEGQSPA